MSDDESSSLTPPPTVDSGEAAAARTPGEEVHAVAMKLPLFWVDNPRMWFQTAEAQFRIKGISRSMTKFDHVLARIPSELTISLADVMAAALSTVNPCRDPYTELKDRLLEATLPGP